jgi:hypothetical protein
VKGNWPNLGWYVDPGERRPEDTDKWAQEIVGAYVKAGFQPEDISLFPHISDSSWFYPTMFQALSESPLALQRFHDYIKAQGLTPEDVGAANWEQVRPLGRSKAIDRPSRRLFYWTIRFFAWDSARHFADMTRALEKVAGPDRPIMVGWSAPLDNRPYQPGPIENNPDKTSPDAARGTHDWLEFGRLRGSTMLWGFFSSAQTYGSFRSAYLRCAAEKGGVAFGGQIDARAAKDGDDLLRDVLAFVGSGGKGLRYHTPIGPTEHDPLACYREDPRVLKRIAEANRAIGKAEELLWPGTRPRAQVAMLAPRSAQLWDKEIISPADYMAEEFNLYTALQHANVPADFLEEDDLSVKGLAPYKVLYVTEPNIPTECQQGLLEWVRKGGTVVTVTGTATLDRYNDPCDILSKELGIAEQPRERAYISAPKASGSAAGTFGKFTAFGPRGTLTIVSKEGNLASFADGSPAIIERKVGGGRVVHFTWMPGLSYSKSPTTSEAIRRAITYPVQAAKVVPPVTVDRGMIETPLLLSAKGGAVTLLNWGSEAPKAVKITARVPFKVTLVESVKQGKLSFNQAEVGVTFVLSLGAADIVLLRP